MNQTKMFQADMFGGSAIAATAAPTRPQAPAQQSTMFDAALTGAAADLVGKGQVPPAYRSILALAGLDSNRQALAVEALGTGRVSTPGAFRAYCAQLGKSQADEAAEKPAAALLLGVVPESAILPDAAEVAPAPALDGDFGATTAPPVSTRPLGKVATAILAALELRGGRLEYGSGEGGWYYLYNQRGLWSARYRANQINPLQARSFIEESAPRRWTITQAGRLYPRTPGQS